MIEPDPVGAWVATEMTNDAATGEPVKLIAVIVFERDGTFRSVLKTVRFGEREPGSTAVTAGEWALSRDPWGGLTMCVRRRGFTEGHCQPFALGEDGSMSWGQITFLRLSEDGLRRIAPELMVLPS
jgi:hypothetical protein